MQKSRTAELLAYLRRDLRWFFVCCLMAFSLIGQYVLGFFTDWRQVLTAIVTSVVLELLLGWRSRGRWVNIISAMMTGVSIGILLTAGPGRFLPYVVAPVIAITVKYLIRYRDSHIFNPSNVGVAAILLLGPGFGVSNPSQWTNAIWPVLMIAALGLIVSYRVKRWDTVATFVLAFLALGLLRHWLQGVPLAYAIGPALGTEFALFTFFMLTDPKTSPHSRRGRVVYCLIVALVDALLRVMKVTYSDIYALTLTCLLVPLLNYHWEWTRVGKAPPKLVPAAEAG